MRVLSHPMRLDNAGAMVTIDDGSDRHAAELAGVIVATTLAERPLAPQYGVTDAIGATISADLIAAAVVLCEPELTVQSVTALPGTQDTSTVRLSVTWAE